VVWGSVPWMRVVRYSGLIVQKKSLYRPCVFLKTCTMVGKITHVNHVDYGDYSMTNKLTAIADTLMQMPNDITKLVESDADGREIVFEVLLMHFDSKLLGYTDPDDSEMRCLLEENSHLGQDAEEVIARAKAYKKTMNEFVDEFRKVVQDAKPWHDVLGEVYQHLGFSPKYNTDAEQLDYTDRCEQGLRTIMHRGEGANKTILEALSKEENLNELRVLCFADDYIDAQMLAIQLKAYGGHNAFGEVAVGVNQEENNSIDVFYSDHDPRIIPVKPKYGYVQPSAAVH